MADVRSTSDTPIVADFANANGTPLVVDRVNGVVYFLDATDTVTAISGGGGGGGAPTNAEYITVSTNGALTQERVLTAGTNVSFVDAGAGSTFTVNAATQFHSATATIDFGTSEDGNASTTVSAAWITGASALSPSIDAVTTADHDPEDAIAEGITVYCEAPGAGSVVVNAAAPEGTWGRYQVRVSGA